MTTNITTITFNTSRKIGFKETEHFRGAVISLFPDNQLYHNHDQSNFIYSYPLIQYKLIGNKPTLVGIGEGATCLDSCWKTGQMERMRIGKDMVDFNVESKSSSIFAPSTTQSTYIIRNWLPFNQENYHRYKNEESLPEKINMMNRLLTGNILSLYKGLDIWLDMEVRTEISEIIKVSTVRYKGVEMICFDVKINSNISLPVNCGIGKGVSKGFGTIIL